VCAACNCVGSELIAVLCVVFVLRICMCLCGVSGSISPIASEERANGMDVSDSSGVEGMPTLPSRSDVLNKYLSSEKVDDPKEMKRQIKFKEQVMKSLRESCDDEISALQQEVDEMKTKLAVKRRPKMTDEILDTTEKTAVKHRLSIIESMSREALLNPPTKKRKSLSLHDDYLEAIQARRSRIEKEIGRENAEKYFAKEKKEWWRDRSKTDKKALVASKWAAIIGLFGTMCSVVQNELIFQSTAPNNLIIDALKMVNTAATVVCLVVIYRLYWLKLIVFRLNRHCRRLTPLNTHAGLYDILSQRTWWVEFFVVGTHCPPFYTGEYETGTFDNVVVYRAETLASLVNTVRIYLVWRYYRDWVLFHLARRHTIASFSGAKFGTVFVLKKSLHGWRATLFILACWMVSLVLVSYWYRSAEFSACYLPTTKAKVCSQSEASEWRLFQETFQHHNDPYIWDSMWLMFITTLTIGYGDISPTTHYGRVTAAFISIIGILLGSLLTAAMMTNLEWTATELQTLRILERAKARDDMRAVAIRRIKDKMHKWIGSRRGGPTGKPPRYEYKTGLAGLTEAFVNLIYMLFGVSRGTPSDEAQEVTTKIRELQELCQGDLNTMATDSEKFGRLSGRCKFLEKAVLSIHDR
jgi:hypothetical protein